MPKLKQPKKPQKKINNKETLQDFFKNYDSVTLINMINSLEANELAWKLFKAYSAYVQREYEVAALDKVAREDSGAAFASGYAKCAEDMQTNFMEGLKKSILGVSDIVENPRPEESPL